MTVFRWNRVFGISRWGKENKNKKTGKKPGVGLKVKAHGASSWKCLKSEKYLISITSK
jgi:hypothetical protein